MSGGKADLEYFQSKRVFSLHGEDLPLYKFMGLDDLSFTRVEDGLVEFKLPVSRNHLNVHRTVHGGVLAFLADLGCLWAVRGNMPLERLERLFTYTQNLRLDYLANVGTGDLIVLGKAVSRLRTYCLAEAEIRDGEGRLLVRAVGQIFVGERRIESWR
jgi:uncharacterized protein (TIGR00369 family)